MTDVDLSAAADVLGRAADRLEKLAAAAFAGAGWAADGEGSVVRESPDDDVVARYCADPDAEFIATVDPHAVAAIVPALQMAAELAELGYADGDGGGEDPRAAGMLIALLYTVARRVLREEETSD